MIIKMIIQVIQSAIKGLRIAQERKMIKVIKMITGEPSLIILAERGRGGRYYQNRRRPGRGEEGAGRGCAGRRGHREGVEHT